MAGTWANEVAQPLTTKRGIFVFGKAKKNQLRSEDIGP